MGLMHLLSALFGQRNAIAETAEVFRENAEAAGQRNADLSAAAMAQFAAEFTRPGPSRFDCFMDGLNRVPRPALALGTLGLLVAAMWDPLWFAERMTGLALVPEPLWWLLGAVVSFYFGGRYQAKGQAFQRDIAATLARAPEAVEAIRTLRTLQEDHEADEPAEEPPFPSRPRPAPQSAATPTLAQSVAVRPAAAADGAGAGGSGNAALDAWRTGHG